MIQSKTNLSEYFNKSKAAGRPEDNFHLVAGEFVKSGEILC